MFFLHQQIVRYRVILNVWYKVWCYCEFTNLSIIAFNTRYHLYGIGHLIFSFHSIPIFNSKNVIGEGKSTSKIENTWKIVKFKVWNICFHSQFLPFISWGLKMSYFKPIILPKNNIYKFLVKENFGGILGG